MADRVSQESRQTVLQPDDSKSRLSQATRQALLQSFSNARTSQISRQAVTQSGGKARASQVARLSLIRSQLMANPTASITLPDFEQGPAHIWIVPKPAKDKLMLVDASGQPVVPTDAWVATTAYKIDDEIIDTNGNIE